MTWYRIDSLVFQLSVDGLLILRFSLFVFSSGCLKNIFIKTSWKKTTILYRKARERFVFMSIFSLRQARHIYIYISREYWLLLLLLLLTTNRKGGRIFIYCLARQSSVINRQQENKHCRVCCCQDNKLYFVVVVL